VCSAAIDRTHADVVEPPLTLSLVASCHALHCARGGASPIQRSRSVPTARLPSPT